MSNIETEREMTIHIECMESDVKVMREALIQYAWRVSGDKERIALDLYGIISRQEMRQLEEKE